MTQHSYLLLLSDRSLKPLRERLKQLKSFYTGIGYAIPFEKQKEAENLCETAGLKLFTQPLPHGHTFESFEQSHKTVFFRERRIALERQVQVLKRELQVEDDLDLTLLQETAKGKELLALLDRIEELNFQIQNSEKFEHALALPEKQSRIRFISQMPTNILLEEPPPIPKLVNQPDGKPFLRKGIVAMLVGAGGVGKTHALAQMALSIATGTPWLGLFPIEKPGSVFLGLGENSEDDIHRLLRKVAKHQTLRFNNSTAPFFDKDPLLAASMRIAPFSFSGQNATFVQNGQATGYYQSLFESLKESEPEDGWACILLDPISRFIGLDAETDNASATQFIALLEKMSMELKGNPTILFGHHMNKGAVSGSQTDQAAARGSSAITDGVRWQVNLEKAKNESEETLSHEVIFRHVKSNFTSIVPQQLLRKDDLGCLFSATAIAPPPMSHPKKGFVTLGRLGSTKEVQG